MNVDGERPARRSLLPEMAVMGENGGRAIPGPEGAEPWWACRGATRWLPPAELVETRDNLYLTVELPGIEAKDLHVSLQGRTVVIKGEKRALNHCGVTVCFSELDYGAFERKVQLPSAAVPEGLMATLARGILILTIPKQ